MDIIIRKENYNDYRAIAEINALAFSREGYIGEVALIDSLRHCPDYDRELSLVAEVNGKVVGHVLFYPFNVVLSSEIIRAVCLAPIAIHPKYQNLGIGGKLIEEGHRILKDKGYKFSFLYGHPNYYPRFGYRTHMFGDCYIEIQKSSIDIKLDNIEEREVRIEDIEVLMDMWEKWYGNVDLSIKPSESILDWISQTTMIKTSIISINGKVKGYLRYNTNNSRDIRMFLAYDKESAEQIIKYISIKIDSDDNVRLPLHPDSAAINMLQSFDYAADIQKWNAGMIKILDEENKSIKDYCDEVSTENRKAGKIIYTPSYDMA